MFFLLSIFISSKIVYYNNTEDLNCYEGHPFVIFCFNNLSKSITKDNIKQIEICSKVMPNIHFLLINCSKFENVCQKYNRGSRNNILYMQKPKFHSFEGEYIAFDLVSFFEGNTDEKRIQIKTSYAELSPDNFSEYISSKSASLIAFLDLSDKMSEMMIPQLEQIAFIYSSNLRYGVAFIDCKKHLDYCIEKNVEYIPTFRSYHNDYSYEDYLGPRRFQDLLNFSNHELQESRSSDGSLDKKVGVITSLFPLIQEFMKAEDKDPIIKKIKAVPGSDNYITIIKRIIKHGEGAIEKEEIKIKKMLNSVQEKISSKDILRVSLNILKEFKRAGPYTPPKYDKNSEL